MFDHNNNNKLLSSFARAPCTTDYMSSSGVRPYNIFLSMRRDIDEKRGEWEFYMSEQRLFLCVCLPVLKLD